MAIVFHCAECKANLRVADDSANKKVRCKECNAMNTAPGAPAPRNSNAPLLVLVLGGAGMLMLASLGGAGAYWVLSRPSAVAQNQNDPDPADNDRPDDPAVVKRKPFVPAPAVALELANGKAEVEVAFDGVEANDRNEVERGYRFHSPAGKVYWVKAEGAAHAGLRVEGPGGEIDAPTDRERSQLAFEATQSGDYTVRVARPSRDAGPLKLTVREMDGSEPLPAQLRLKRGGAALPRFTEIKVLDSYEKQFASAAFSTDGKSFYMSHADGTVSYWADGKQAGAFVTGDGNLGSKQMLFGLAVDHKGRVYAQRVTGRIRGKRRAGDISVWDGLVPKGASDPLPAPTRTLMLDGIVAKMIASPDGKYVYFLDVQNRKVGRIDADAGKIDGQIEAISAGAVSMCLTADGKKLYCCSSANKIDVIDAASFRLTKTVSFDKGTPRDIAATNAGMVIMAGWGERDDAEEKCSAFLVDLTKGLPDETRVVALPVRRSADVVRVLPDQSAALFGADRHILTCSIPARPALDAAVVGEGYSWDYFLPGNMAVSPDGRTVLLDVGRVLSVGR